MSCCDVMRKTEYLYERKSFNRMDMKQTIQIRCKNNKKIKNFAIGSTLSDVFREFNLEMDYGPISAKVNNKVEGLNYRVYHSKDVEFLDIRSASGSRAYTRTLFFVLCKAAHDVWPGAEVVIDIPVSNGYYCNINIGRPLTEADADALRSRMQQIIDDALPIRRHECTTEEAIGMFSEMGMDSKVKLLKSVGSLYTTYYEIDGYKDYYYGTLLTNTRQLYLFGLEKYYDGMLLRIPLRDDPSRLGDLIRQDKMFEIFKEHHRWQKILGMSTVGDFNDAVKERPLYRPYQRVGSPSGEEDIADCRHDSGAQGRKSCADIGPVVERQDNVLQASVHTVAHVRHQARADFFGRLFRQP